MSEIKVVFGEEPSVPPPTERPFVIRLVVGLVLLAVVMVASAIGWGYLAYLTDSIYLVVAILIGIGVAGAVSYPFKRVSWGLALLLALPVAALTAVTVLAGDAFYVALVARSQLELNLSNGLQYALQNSADWIGDSVSSVVFGLIGAGLGILGLVKGNK